MTAKLSTAAATAALDAVKALLNDTGSTGHGGYIKIYSGTQPADPDTALSGNTLLATFVFAATAFGSDSGPAAGTSGTLTTTGSIPTTTVTAAATGTASFARLFKSDGTTAVLDLTVGTSGTDVILNSTSITVSGNVTLSSFTGSLSVH